MALVKCPECKSKISSEAQSCPKCGSPIDIEKINKIKKDGNKVGVGCAIVFVIVLFIYLISQCSSDSESATTENTDVNLETPTVDPEIKLPPKERIAKAHYLLSPAKVYDDDISNFTTLANDLKDTEYSKAVNKTLDSLTKIRKVQVAKEGTIERKGYEEKLRNGFLDGGLDIKVRVSGKNNTILTLTYALFSDVWFRKFETEGYFDNLHQKGFNKIVLSDNYDYNRYVYWDK